MKGIAKKVVDRVKKSISKEKHKIKVGNRKLPAPPKIPQIILEEKKVEQPAPVVLPEGGIRIIDLIKEKNIPIRVSQITVPVYRDPGNNWQKSYGPTTFPSEKVIMIGAYAYTPFIVSIQCNIEGQQYPHNYNVPNDFIVFKLPAEEANAILSEQRKKMLANLKTYMPSLTKYTSGTDPEIFVEDENGRVLPAFNFLGSKAKPDKTPTNDQQRGAGGFDMYWDGFQGEFTTTATGCAAYVLDSIYFGLLGIYQKAIKFNPKAKLSGKPVLDIPEQMLKESKDEHVEFGCMPSLNVYDMSGRKCNGREVTFRPAGGHLHFGVGQQTKEKYVAMVKALDKILGVICVSMFEGIDDPRRRELYGLAGEYRLPPHGLEYRTLSNAWLFHPILTMLVFDIGRRALHLGELELLDSWQTTDQETIQCINSNDVAKAREILERNKTFLVDILYSIYNDTWTPKQTREDSELLFNCILKGAKSFLRDPQDVVGNWNLADGKWVYHNRGGIYEEGRHWIASSKVIREGKKV